MKPSSYFLFVEGRGQHSTDQLTLVRLKQAAALFSSFSETCSVHFLVSFSDSSELHAECTDIKY